MTATETDAKCILYLETEYQEYLINLTDARRRLQEIVNELLAVNVTPSDIDELIDNLQQPEQYVREKLLQAGPKFEGFNVPITPVMPDLSPLQDKVINFWRHYTLKKLNGFIPLALEGTEVVILSKAAEEHKANFEVWLRGRELEAFEILQEFSDQANEYRRITGHVVQAAGLAWNYRKNCLQPDLLPYQATIENRIKKQR